MTTAEDTSFRQEYRIEDIKPNPFRDTKRYPLRPGKVAALRESIRNTGLWPNLVARLGADGKPELTYGHHRFEALRRASAAAWRQRSCSDLSSTARSW